MDWQLASPVGCKRNHQPPHRDGASVGAGEVVRESGTSSPSSHPTCSGITIADADADADTDPSLPPPAPPHHDHRGRTRDTAEPSCRSEPANPRHWDERRDPLRRRVLLARDPEWLQWLPPRLVHPSPERILGRRYLGEGGKNKRPPPWRKWGGLVI